MVYKSKSKIEIVFSRLALHTAFVVVVVIVAAIVGIICIIFFIIFTADVHFESVLNGGPKKALGKHSPNCRGDKWLNTSYTHTHTYTQRQTVVLISLTYSIDTGSIWGLCLSLGLASGFVMEPASDILTLFTSLSLLIFLIICPSKLTSHRARNPPRAFVSLSLPLSDQSRSLPLMMIAQFAQ